MPPSDVRRDASRRGPPPAVEALSAWSWRLLVIAAAAGVVVYALIRLRLVVLPVVVALFASTLLVPPRRWLTARGIPRLAAALAVLLLALGLAAGLGAALAPGVSSQAGVLAETVSDGIGQVDDWLHTSLGITERDVDEALDRAARQLRENASGIASGVVSGAMAAGELLAGLLLTLVVLFFFVKDGDLICAWIADRLPFSGRDVTRRIGSRSWATLGAYVRGQAIVGFVDASVIGVGLALLDVPLVLPLTVLTFLAAFLPLIGAVLAGFLAALVALVAGGLTKALFVVGLVVVVQQLEGDLLAPLILGRAVKLHPLVVLLALTAGGVLGGIVGAVLSVPLTAVAVAAAAELRRPSLAVAGPDGAPPA